MNPRMGKRRAPGIASPLLTTLVTLALAWPGTAAELTRRELAEGFVPLFNGSDLSGWDGDPRLWSVAGGSIVGSTDGRPLSANSFLVSEREFGDFVLRFEVKLRNGNSGMQFRSEQTERWTVRGYQADFASGKGWGNLHGEGLPRGLILDGWQDRAEHVVATGWNRVEVLCEGYRIRISVNGTVTNDVLDPGALTGVLAMQLHRGEPMRVEFRNIRIRTLGGRSTPSAPDSIH